MTKLTSPVPKARAYAVAKPDHLRSVNKLLAGQGTGAQRKQARDQIARRYPGLKLKDETP